MDAIFLLGTAYKLNNKLFLRQNCINVNWNCSKVMHKTLYRKLFVDLSNHIALEYVGLLSDYLSEYLLSEYLAQ